MIKKKIILIQDNETILQLLDQVLEEEGYDVTASLTIEPIENILKIDPDIIIIDDHIKGKLTGSQIIKRLKSNTVTNKIPAILSSTSSNIVHEAILCDADGLIEKPFEIEDVLNLVKKNI